MKNYYEILEVNKLASKEVIDKAYKVLVKKYHPDTQSGKSKTFYENKIKDINEAYEVLSNEFLREQYNLELEKEKQTKNNINNERKQSNQQKRTENSTENNESNYKVGTLSGVVELVKQLSRNMPKPNIDVKPSSKGIFAAILTVIIVLIIGSILWFIPFTNGWIRELTVDNPLLSWIWK